MIPRQFCHSLIPDLLPAQKCLILRGIGSCELCEHRALCTIEEKYKFDKSRQRGGRRPHPLGSTAGEDQVTDDDSSLDRGEENDGTMLDSEDMGSGTELPNSEDVSIDLGLIGDYCGEAPLFVYNVVDKKKGTPAKGTSAKILVAYETHFRFRGK